jgi:hypothetical protein
MDDHDGDDRTLRPERLAQDSLGPGSVVRKRASLGLTFLTGAGGDWSRPVYLLRLPVPSSDLGHLPERPSSPDRFLGLLSGL